MALLLASGAVGAAGAGCSSTPAPAFAEAFAAGQRAQNAGRSEEALASFDRAYRKADRVKDRDEALFLKARTLERMGRRDEADATYRAIEDARPRGPRAVHASFDRARLAGEVAGEATRDAKEIELVGRYPDDGLAVAALERIVNRRTESPAELLPILDGLTPRVKETSLEQAVDVERARALDAVGRSEEALALLLATARAHPYPLGDRTDDALLEASEIEERLGRPDRAVAHLREMLAPREPSHAGASYDRPKFPAAQLRIATLLRDALRDREAARRELLRLWNEFPDSTLRDDALWMAARLAREGGDEEQACDDARRLAKDLPDSRYSRCGHLVCSSIEPTSRPCAAYVERTFTGEDPVHGGEEPSSAPAD